MLLLPSQRERTTGEQYQYDRFSCFQQLFQQILLYIRDTQIRAAAAFTAHLRRFAKRSNDDIRPAGYVESLVQQLPVCAVVAIQGTAEHRGAFFVGSIANQVASFGIHDIRLSGSHLFQPLNQ